MKIGILTFHRAHNYGAVLQTYGLQEYIKLLGHEVYIIDYVPNYTRKAYPKFSITNWLSKSPIRTIKKILEEPFLCRDRIIRWNNFNRFITERLNLYPYNNHNNFTDFDAIVLGSDQIWNQKITGGDFDKVYFGENAACKVISYAASNQSVSLTNPEKEFYRKQLNHIAAISVREKTLQQLLQPLINKPIHLVLDPTLLSGIDVFQKIAISPKIQDKKYILVYEITPHDYTQRIAKSIASQIDADIIELVSTPFAGNLGQKRQTASPEEFIGYFKDAECIITTSFHGTAFSIMFNKPFYSIRQNKNVDIRINSLLSTIGLENRFIDNNITPSFKDIDYKESNELLQQQVKQSQLYLKNALTSI